MKREKPPDDLKRLFLLLSAMPSDMTADMPPDMTNKQKENWKLTREITENSVLGGKMEQIPSSNNAATRYQPHGERKERRKRKEPKEKE